jgi:hypothetical protein
MNADKTKQIGLKAITFLVKPDFVVCFLSIGVYLRSSLRSAYFWRRLNAFYRLIWRKHFYKPIQIIANYMSAAFSCQRNSPTIVAIMRACFTFARLTDRCPSVRCCRAGKNIIESVNGLKKMG